MYLIDTDIIVYAIKGRSAVVENFKRNAAKPKAISVVTYGELLFGALRSDRQQENLARVRRITDLFQVLEVTRAVMDTFCSVKAELARKGKPIQDFDLVISATALLWNYCLVTNNERHFRRIPGLRIENWTKALS